MDDNAKARDLLQEQAAVAGQHWGVGCGHEVEGRPGPSTGSCGPTQGGPHVLPGKVAGHCWDGWRRLTGDEGYFAACSCGWRSSETGCVSPMLHQVEEHLDDVRAVRVGRLSAQTAQAPARDEQGRDAGQRWMRPDERTRELYAAVESQQRRLAQVLKHTGDLLSASQDQAGCFVAVLEHAADRVAPEWAKTGASVRREEALQRQAERAKQWRDGIAAAAGALAAIAEEAAVAGQDLVTRYRDGPADNRRPAEAAHRYGREFVTG